MGFDSIPPRNRALGCRLATCFSLATAVLACEGAPEDAGQAKSALCTPPPGVQSPAPLRRLTRFEYGRSIRDLTGADSSVAQRLPPDEEIMGFDNNAGAYSISTLHAAKYLEVAEEVAEVLLADDERLASFAGCQPLADSDCVEAFVRAFGERAYRRPLRDAELEALLGLFQATATPGPSEGLSAVVTAVLQAPQFLYRPEAPGSGASASVDTYALATRLAYLLTSAPPDAELLEAATDGSLATPEGLDEQTDRLLATPEALETFLHFLSQWWELDGLSTLEKDRTLVRGWTAQLPAAFGEELRHFVADAWSRQPTLEVLLRASYTFVDRRLASFYGYELPSGSGFERVELDPSRASGLLTQGALLASHAKANQTSPVDRGKFVRARLFCTPPEPPPPNLVVVAPRVNPRLSTRERFAEHSRNPACSGCHALMDPIGFAFENYDAAGRWRDTDGGAPVDATGELAYTDVDGTFEGVPELAQRLLQSGEVRSCVALQWFRYAFGRGEQTEHDTCTVAALEGALSRRGDLREMVRATVRQPLFLEAPPPEIDP